MFPTVLVPVRIAPTAKRRLAHVLDPQQRMDFVRRSFDHVSGVLREAGCRVVALTPEPIDVPPEIDLWLDEAPGLNRAVTAASLKLGAPVLVVHADLPWLTAQDVYALNDTDADVAIARATDGGTTGLLMRKLIMPAYGPGSALRHAQIARGLGLSALVVDIPGFARDVDDPRALTASSSAFLQPRP
jgi:2-phospho-L-lactate guanylyltransferase